MTLGLGPRARLRRARQGRGDVVPVQTEHYEVGAQGRRHGALPARARLAPRGPARRPELPELLRRAPGEQVRQGRARRDRAATSCSPATRGATTARSSTTTSTTTSRSTTASGTGWCRTRVLPRLFRPDVWREVAGAAHDRHLPRRLPGRDRRRRRPRTTSTTRSTSRRRPSCTACSLVEDKLSMAHSLETPRAVPRQRPRRLRAAAAGPRSKLRDLEQRRAAQRERAAARRPSATSSRPATASCCCGR